MAYPVQDGSLYVQPVGTPYRFQLDSADILRNDGGRGLTGTYVRVN